jgi:hypothetical protein
MSKAKKRGYEKAKKRGYEKVLEFIKKENEALLNSIPPKKENPMTLDDYWNVKQELVSWLDPESAEEVEKYLAKLGYKIIKI